MSCLVPKIPRGCENPGQSRAKTYCELDCGSPCNYPPKRFSRFLTRLSRKFHRQLDLPFKVKVHHVSWEFQRRLYITTYRGHRYCGSTAVQAASIFVSTLVVGQLSNFEAVKNDLRRAAWPESLPFCELTRFLVSSGSQNVRHLLICTEDPEDTIDEGLFEGEKLS